MRPYAQLMRLDRPIGIWLLLLPGLWGIALASGGISGLGLRGCYYIVLFVIGSILMRGAGCIINDLWDRDIDKMVERTKNRPLASGEVAPKDGLLFLATLLLISLLILLQFNVTTILLGFLAIPLIVSYPLMKRVTWWPQAFLGLTFNFSALMGFSAVTGEIALPALLLYLGGIFWTLGYDTIYAHQDKEDDALAGIKSTALKFGDKSKIWVGAFFSACVLFVFLARLVEHGGVLLLFLIIVPLLHFVWQLKKWKPDDQSSSLLIFKSNMVVGLLILLVFMI